MLERLHVALALCVTLIAAGSGEVRAQAFYAGKSIQLVIGVSPGGGYDLWGRTMAKHLGRHLPGNPTIVPQNMPGAGSLLAANHLYNVAPKDGTTIGIIARDTPLVPLMGSLEGGRFDATRFGWIGNPSVETSVCFTYHTAAAKTLKDLYEKEVVLGTVGVGSGSYNYPRLISRLLGLKIKLVTGFPGSAEVFLAIERGEVDGFCEGIESVLFKRPDWLATKKISILFQGGSEPNPELKDVPFILDAAPTPEDRQAMLLLYAPQGIGRPFLAPPGLPPERLEALRSAFDATVKDPEFVAEIKKQGLDVVPKSGKSLEALIKQIYATPKPVVEKVTRLLK